jgi:hypothetical protein
MAQTCGYGAAFHGLLSSPKSQLSRKGSTPAHLSRVMWSRFCGQVLRKGFVPKRRSDLPRSGYTEQPRASALGYASAESALKVAAEASL